MFMFVSPTWTTRRYDGGGAEGLLQLFLLFAVLGASVLEPDLREDM